MSFPFFDITLVFGGNYSGMKTNRIDADYDNGPAGFNRLTGFYKLAEPREVKVKKWSRRRRAAFLVGASSLLWVAIIFLARAVFT